MAIKHLGNKAANGWRAPTATDIEEREIAIDLAEPALYTKDESGGIIKISERGGIAWDVRQDYKIGDIVVDSNRNPQMAFLALQNNAGAALPTSGINANWQELDTIFYNVTSNPLLNPLSDNYPDTTGEHIGATWYITGVGVDANGDSNKYTYTAGNLAGISVADGDRLTWVDGVAPTEVWFHSPYPRINGERAGMLWRSGEDYLIGDTATYAPNNTTYVALKDSTGTPPNSDPTSWKKVGGAGPYDPTVPYESGDIISCCDDIWIAPPGGVLPTDPAPGQPGSPWILTTPDERAGMLWRTGQAYLAGDLVTRGNDIYRALLNNSSTPETNPLDWTNINTTTSLGMTPVGGIIMYDGLLANIPSNWALCDGSGGTPDLRGRFIRGGEITDIGTIGGINTATMPSHDHTANHNHASATTNSVGGHSHTANHNHTASTAVAGSHSHNLNIYLRTKEPGRDHDIPLPYSVPEVGSRPRSQIVHSGGTHSHGVTINTKNFSTSSVGNHSHTLDIPNLNVTTSTAAGTGGTEGNLPAYYTLAYIKRIS